VSVTATTTPWQRVRLQAVGEIEGTPGRMRLWGLAAVLAVVVFGLGAAQSFRLAHDAIARAGDNTAQLVRVQQIHTSLVRADANATNAFLVGGLEPAEQHADYVADIGRATQLIAEASSAQPADARALAELNTQLVAYAGLVERARANNRLGLPVGAQYLRNASAILSDDSLPILGSLASSNEERVQEEFDAARRAFWLLAGVGVLGLGVLGFVLWWLAQRTHRVVNLPLAGAALAVLVMSVGGLLGLAASAGQVSQVQDASYSSALAAAKARVAAFDAKSNESLTLISRGSGSAFEKAWQSSAAEVQRQLPRVTTARGDLKSAWGAYVDAHARVRSTDNGGSWDRAVALAINRSDAEAPNQVFAQFDEASGAALDSASSSISDGLSAAGAWMPWAGAVVLVLSIVAAGLAWRGMSERLEEYR
jgi:hypothetical protein